MINRYDAILDECLASLRAGESLDDCLARYPKHASRLRPVLSLATRVQSSPRVLPRAQAQETAWRHVRERAHQLRTGSKRVSAVRMTNYGAFLKPAMAVLGVFLVVASFGGGLAIAAQDASPDSPLYSVKLQTEDIRLWLVFDDTREAEILLDQSDQRIEEIRELVSQGKPVSQNVLSALDDRNRRAAAILQDKPKETALRARVLTQAELQEQLLVALYEQIEEGARDTYTVAVARLHNTRLSGGTGDALVSVRPEDLLGGILDVSGLAQQLDDGTWLIGGMEVKVDERTIGRTNLQPGATARFVVARSSNGRLQALSLIGTYFENNEPGGSAFVSGTVESITDAGIVVGGIEFPWGSFAAPSTIRPGDRVQVKVDTTDKGAVASSVKPATTGATAAAVHSFTLEGTIEGDVSQSTSSWQVSGLDFEITSSTTVDASGGDVRNGARVQVEGLADGSRLRATQVTVLAREAPATDITIVGTFQGNDNGVWVVGGLPIAPDFIADDPPQNGLVTVNATREGDEFFASNYDVIVAPEQQDLIRLQGTIKTIDGVSWTMEFGDIRVDSTAEVTGGDPGVGQRALIWSERGVDGRLEAVYVRVLDAESILAPVVDVVTTPAP
ncbi:MAG TPA: DUF5666 domain-containing protein [Dehalococcoidia bacterium]|nr:DUF5666 domain-containing protein [Dehalococcoidia bacterium]